MVTLYELTEDLLDLIERTDDPEIPEASESKGLHDHVEQWLQDVERALAGDALEEKLEQCAAVVRQLDADETSLRTELERFQRRVKTVKAHRERLKSYMSHCILTLVEPDPKGRRRVETQRFKLWVQKNPMSVDTDQCDLVELDGRYVKFEPKVKAREIIDEIKSTGVIPNGAKLKEERWSVRIR